MRRSKSSANPTWAGPTAAPGKCFSSTFKRRLEVARRIHSRQIAVLAAADPNIPHAEQVQALVENLRYAADLAQRDGVTLELEGVSSPMLPPMIVHRLDDIVQVIDRVSSPNVRLIYDTGHVQAIEGDAAAHLGRVYDYIDIVQLADQPGRLEPGRGTIDFESILTQIAPTRLQRSRRVGALLEDARLEAERAGLETLRKLDARVREHLRHVD